MEWLTAILAFATTMLIFSMITSTFVETFHRLAGSRSFGLIKMLEHMYDHVIDTHMKDPQQPTSNEKVRRERREKFVKQMIMVRAPALSAVEMPDTAASLLSSRPVQMLLGFLKGLLFVIRSPGFLLNRVSYRAYALGVGQWRLLSYLPIVTFMERLATSPFSAVWKKKYASDPALGEQVLQDIGQKFELYGQEASVYFERKARLLAVPMAVFVAWTFYVHPYDLIQTYLQRPEIAAKVADLKDDLLEGGAQLKDVAQSEVDELLEKLQAVEAPIGWTDGKGGCVKYFKTVEWGCLFPLPNNRPDIVWLLIGGLLVGLGAPFWAKAVRRIAEVKDAPKNVAKILKPEVQPQAAQDQPLTPSATARSEAIQAFYVAVAAGQAQPTEPDSPTGANQQEGGE